mgnify:CR=1 FL=1
MRNWKSVIAAFCIPINVFLIIAGILIKDIYTVGIAIACIGLVTLPLIQDYFYYEKKDEKENDSQQEKT